MRDNRSIGFPAIESRDARVLILGSLPGVRSIAAGEYYAHPRNHFWAIMEALLGIPLRGVPYEQRTAALRARKIALWDVLADAQRTGSLDAAIKNPTPNDLKQFAASHRSLSLVCFNGKTAASLYKKHALIDEPSSYKHVTLPSSSPAHAVTLEAKLREWAVIQDYL